MLARLAALISGLALAACSTVGVRSAEEPAYTVSARIGELEVREYGPRIAAETVVDGTEEASRSAGFRRLAGYIFGGNDGGANIAMTAPVAQTSDAGGQWRMRLVMPAGFTLASLPRPNDPAVKLVAVPPETVAVLRFSGSIAAAAVAQQTGALVAALEASAWRPAGAPVAWFYDPPWTVPGLRRNEVAVPVSPK